MRGLDKETESQWQAKFSLTEEEFAECKNSYQRTMDILAPGLEKCQGWLQK